ncbi:helix-turn-helix transcriptional regulator [Shinella sp.]|uniref:helix-turn-helix domain-containing protein n=2 Tax=Shinella TaxID=323620 RepID=UPI0026130DE1|nr:helix-turn-helix transcriptional regulator [Shinella sp.]
MVLPVAFVVLYLYSVNIDCDEVQKMMRATTMKMARAGLGWGVRELAERAGVTANTVTRIENGADAKKSTMDAIQAALEQGAPDENGGWRFAEFISPDGVRIVEGGVAPPDE